MDRDFNRNYRFESNMTIEQHAHYNKILNETVNRSQAREYKVSHLLEAYFTYLINQL